VDGDRLDDEQIALVLRRATELDGQSRPGQAGLDLDLLEEAAVEAGLSRESVRRAVAELRAGALVPAEPTPARRRRLGPDTVTVSRCVPGPATQVDDILRRFLSREQFHLRRDFGSSAIWTRRQDMRARVKVQYDRSIHRRLMLRDAEQVEMAVAEEPGDRGMVMVKLTVDVKALLREHRQSVGKGAGIGLTTAALGVAVLGMPEALVVVPGATAAGVAVGHHLGVNHVRTAVDDLTTRLEGFLDGVERRKQ
jgi:hypothetical protein